MLGIFIAMAIMVITTNLKVEFRFETKTFQIIAVKNNYLVVQDDCWRKYYLSTKSLEVNDKLCLNRYLSISGTLKPINLPVKPYSFNFEQYLAKQAINYEIKVDQVTILNSGWLYHLNDFYQQNFPTDYQQIFFFANLNHNFALVKALNSLSLKYLLNFSGLTIFWWDWCLTKLGKQCHLPFKVICGLKVTFCGLLLIYSFTLRLPFVLTKTTVFLLIKNFYWLKNIKIDKFNLWIITFAILLTFHLEIIFSTTIIYYLLGLAFFQKPTTKSFWKIISLDLVITTLTFGLLEGALTYRFHYFTAFFVSLLAPQISFLNLFVTMTFWIPKIEIVHQFLTTQLLQQISCLEKINFYYALGKINYFYYLALFLGLFIIRTFWSRCWEIGVCLILTASLIAGLFCYKFLFMPYGFHVLDVGNGLTTIYLDHNNLLVFDAGVGPGHDKHQLSDFCKFYGLNRIDYLFISHAHADHYNELENVLASGLKVKVVIQKENALETYQLKGVELHVFNRQQHSLNENNNSLVIVLKTLTKTFLLPGDLEHQGEKKLLVDKSFLALLAETPIDYLIIGHHGSKTSSSVAWLQLIHPKFAIISGEIKGFNRFPNIETRNVLKAQNIPYFVTSETGDLWIK